MKKYLIMASFINSIAWGVVGSNEIILQHCQKKGRLVFSTCISVPPTTSEQAAYCRTIHLDYNACLQTLNSPLPLVVSIDPSPYVWSPYDICRFETGHMALPDLCPSLPIP